MCRGKHLLFFVTEDWYFASHRLAVAASARRAGYLVTVVTRVRADGDRIRAAGIRVIPFENVRGSLSPVKELSTLLRLIAIYRREKPDVVHHVAIKPVLYGTVAALLAKTPRIINAVAGMGWLFTADAAFARRLRPLVRWGMGRLLRSGTVVVQNPDDGRLLAQFGVPDANIRRIAGAGVNLEHFQPHPEPSGPVVVVLPARLIWAKGVGEFVAAARLLRNEGVAATFVLAGEPDQSNRSSVPTEQISAWVREGVIEYRGWVADMARLFAECHIVCMPSYYGEGIPKSLIEAAAAGRPIITSNMPGCREIVHDTENGLLVPPRDIDLLAAALRKLIADPQMRRRMGKRGRERAEIEFGLDSVIRETLALYGGEVKC